MDAQILARMQLAANGTFHILGYTVFSYRVLRGKTGELRYA